LAGEFTIHVVAEWLGNSPKTAVAHCMQTTEEHYRQASQGGAKRGALEAQNAAQQAVASVGENSQESSEVFAICEDKRALAGGCENR
jgi:hypothetical protein